MIEVKRCAAGHIQQAGVLQLALDLVVAPAQRVLEVVGDVLVELLVLVVRHLGVLLLMLMTLTGQRDVAFGTAVSEERDQGLVHGIYSPILMKNLTIPRTERKSFLTIFDWQESVHVEIYQGDAPMCSNNTLVGEFDHPMTPAPAGTKVVIEMSYSLDGRIEATAVDSATGKRTTCEWHTGSRNLTSEERAAAKDRIDQRWSSPAGSSGTPQVERQKEATSAQPWEKSPLWQGVSALYRHAASREEELEPADAKVVSELLRRLESCAASEDRDGLERAEIELTNRLFDLE